MISFDGSTTVEEFTQCINKTVNIRDSKYSGFSLFSDHPVNTDVDQCLQLHVKVRVRGQGYHKHNEKMYTASL